MFLVLQRTIKLLRFGPCTRLCASSVGVNKAIVQALKKGRSSLYTRMRLVWNEVHDCFCQGHTVEVVCTSAYATFMEKAKVTPEKRDTWRGPMICSNWVPSMIVRKQGVCSCEVCCNLLHDQAGQLVDVEEIREKTQKQTEGCVSFQRR